MLVKGVAADSQELECPWTGQILVLGRHSSLVLLFLPLPTKLAFTLSPVGSVSLDLSRWPSSRASAINLLMKALLHTLVHTHLVTGLCEPGCSRRRPLTLLFSDLLDGAPALLRVENSRGRACVACDGQILFSVFRLARNQKSIELHGRLNTRQCDRIIADDVVALKGALTVILCIY